MYTNSKPTTPHRSTTSSAHDFFGSESWMASSWIMQDGLLMYLMSVHAYRLIGMAC
jgi:hypothetical protein